MLDPNQTPSVSSSEEPLTHHSLTPEPIPPLESAAGSMPPLMAASMEAIASVSQNSPSQEDPEGDSSEHSSLSQESQEPQESQVLALRLPPLLHSAMPTLPPVESKHTSAQEAILDDPNIAALIKKQYTSLGKIEAMTEEDRAELLGNSHIVLKLLERQSVLGITSDPMTIEVFFSFTKSMRDEIYLNSSKVLKLNMQPKISTIQIMRLETDIRCKVLNGEITPAAIQQLFAQPTGKKKKNCGIS